MHCQNSLKIISSNPLRIISTGKWMYEFMSNSWRDDKTAKQFKREISEDLTK